MRIGYDRVVQKSCSKHVPSLQYALLFGRLCPRAGLRTHRFSQHGHISERARYTFTTTATRSDKTKSKIQQQDEAFKTVTQARDIRSKSAQPIENSQQDGSKAKSSASRKARARHDPDTAIALLDQFLPQQLRTGLRPTFPKPQDLAATNENAPARILQTMHNASIYGARVDLLTYMGINQGRWKAVLCLADTLLQDASTRMLDPQGAQTPSNLVWGPGEVSLGDLTSEAVAVAAPSYTHTRSIGENAAFKIDPRYSDLAFEDRDRVMAQIWYSLGSLTIEAADLPEEESEVVMAVVYQIIAKIHALGLVPDNVYSFKVSDHSTMARRPPILHLLSSRVLTTLSDATWRSHQLEVIEQAVEGGTSLQNLVKDLPGGRFRLKVRPLGPEVWLEFILWCCVEGGFGFSGSRLIRRLRQQTEHPWFAVPWTSEDGKLISNMVDWDRVRSRHGGTVGLIEGYNKGPPFVEMVPRTVSAEVVLSLVETMVNSANMGCSNRWLSQIMDKEVPSLIEFLEPHSLPTEYFDYLAVRVLQTDCLDVHRVPEMLERWVERLSNLRSLERTYKDSPATVTFDITSVLKQSEVYAGMLHQTMEAYVERSDIRSSVAVFNRIQELVDASKLQSISSFLATTSIESDRFFNSQEFFSQHPSTGNVDFLESHGQLPLHKLASFLNLSTDSKLLRIGQWLLYSDDVDEPLIPQRLYGTPALMTALVRFADVSGDEELVKSLIAARKKSSLLPSVSLLRSWVDAFISSSNFQEAHRMLVLLRRAKGGGYGLMNITRLAAATMSLERRAKTQNDSLDSVKLRQALQLGSSMLSGSYDAHGGAFRKDVLMAFRQQLAAVLHVLSAIRGSRISSLARKWQVTYSMNNRTLLSAEVFNVLLASVVDVQGASEGRRFWHLFCEHESSGDCSPHLAASEEQSREDDMFVNDENYLPSTQVLPVSDAHMARGEYVPFATSDYKLLPEVSTNLEDEVGDKIVPKTGTREDSEHFMDSFPVKENESELLGNPEPKPLVRPDLRTLRIIVRAAVAERRAREEEGLDTSLQKEVLDWAAHIFLLFGVKKAAIEEEVQQAVDEHAAIIQQQQIREANQHAALLRGRQSGPPQINAPFRSHKVTMGISGQSKPVVNGQEQVYAS